MLNVDQYLQIRLLHRDGLSIREIARRLGHGRETVKKALIQPSPRPYTRSVPAVYPKLGAFIAVIDRILKEDESAPRKQRHTAARIFARLRDERGYTGKYDQVRRYVGAHRRRERETHLLLDHPPGGRLECDFGHIHVDYPHGRELVPVLIVVWSYSHYPFVMALPDETCGSILHGTVCAFEFFGCVPAELWWDNPTTVAKAILRGRDRQLNPHYGALASHYRFAPMFCMPRKGQEKSDAERTVFALQRRFATPVPAVKDIDELNRHLLGCCLAERDRTVSGNRAGTIGEMFEVERAHAVELAERPFDACIQHIRQADKYQTVLFEEVRYSVPRPVAFEPVTVKAYLQQIVIVHKGQVVARHPRSRTAGDQVLEPLHFLAVLERKPAYLDQTRLFKDYQALKLPAAFGELRKRLARELGERAGTRHYIRVLQLLGRYNVREVAQAIEACLDRTVLRAEVIEQKLAALSALTAPGALATSATPVSASLASTESTDSTTSATSIQTIGTAHSVHPITHAPCAPHIPDVRVPPPDLRRFDQLLYSRSSQDPQDHQTEQTHQTLMQAKQAMQTHQDTQGIEGESHVPNVQDARTPRNPPIADAAEASSEDAEAADHAVGVCQALA